jgi:(p)ppGpp synthase/HD superfamily hydrolase
MSAGPRKSVRAGAARTKPLTQRAQRSHRVKLGPRFLRAFVFAAEKHAGQTRKASTIPYIAHLMGVASLALEFGSDEDAAIAALLHDVVEDCGGAPMLKEVRRKFGRRVAKIVDGCTDSDTEPKPPWRERKESYIRHLKHADRDTRLVSAADKLNNVRSILADYREVGESVWARFHGGREGTLWYYRALLQELLRKPNRLIRELELAVRELEAGAEACAPRGSVSRKPFPRKTFPRKSFSRKPRR